MAPDAPLGFQASPPPLDGLGSPSFFPLTPLKGAETEIESLGDGQTRDREWLRRLRIYLFVHIFKTIYLSEYLLCAGTFQPPGGPSCKLGPQTTSKLRVQSFWLRFLPFLQTLGTPPCFLLKTHSRGNQPCTCELQWAPTLPRASGKEGVTQVVDRWPLATKPKL